MKWQKNIYFLLSIPLILFLSINLASAWSNNTFTNSLTAENLTFGTYEQITGIQVISYSNQYDWNLVNGITNCEGGPTTYFGFYTTNCILSKVMNYTGYLNLQVYAPNSEHVIFYKNNVLLFNYTNMGPTQWHPKNISINNGDLINITGDNWGAIRNISYYSTDTRIRNISIPQNTYLTNAYMNLSGLYIRNNNTPTRFNSNTTTNSNIKYGITGNGTNIFVLDGANNLNVYNNSMSYITNYPGLYGALTGSITNNNTNLFYVSWDTEITIATMSGSKISSFSVSTPATVSANGITNNGTNLFFTRGGSIDSVFNYRMDGTYMSNFTTFNNPSGIAYYDGYLHVLDNSNDMVYVYTMNGTLTNINYSLNARANGYGFYIDNINNKTLYRISQTGTNNPVDMYDMKTYTNNLNITINNNIFYNPSEYKTNNRTFNFASYINNYLASCSYLNGYCNIPINFYSSTIGILQYSDLLFSNTGITENNQSYTPFNFETQSSAFSINITYDDNIYTSSSANLIYNGTSYTSTKTGSNSNYLFSKTIDLPLVNYPTENRSFYWNISLTNSSGTYSFLSNTYYQVVNRTYLYICNLTYNVPYVNFTFQDESALTTMNASVDESTWSYYLGLGSVMRTYSFINVSMNPSYAFCYNPSYKTVNTVLQYLKYSATGYPQRQYYYNSTYSNTTTNTNLGLLASANGIYTSIQTLKGAGNPLSGVLVVAERFYGGSYLTVGTGITDEAGIVTFWVNPNYPLRLTATKVGYPQTQVTINPSQTQYSLYMGTTSGNTTYSMSTNGLRWTIFPANGVVNTTTFGMNMTAYYGDIVACKLDLIKADDSTTLTTTSGGGGSDCNISLTYTLPTGVRVFGQFYVWTTASGGYFLIDSDALWYNLTTSTPSPWTNIQSLFHDLNNIPEFGTDDLRQEFSKVIIFFFVLCLFIGILCFFTEYDRLYPGFFVVIVWIVIFTASKGGFLTLDFGSALTNTAMSNTMKQYMVAMISGLFTFGYVINRFARDT